jgi:23S rRNA (cytosine1962-C5)-methyltransferase
MLSERVETIDQAFYLGRIAGAEAHRKRVVADSEAYRLVHGEGDQLPGLVIDRYGDYSTLPFRRWIRAWMPPGPRSRVV